MIAGWFSKLWARLAIIGGVVLAVLVAALRLRASGAAEERARQAAAAGEAVNDRMKVEHETRRMDDVALDHANADWVRRP